jgi:hypothetical protein
MPGGLQQTLPPEGIRRCQDERQEMCDRHAAGGQATQPQARPQARPRTHDLGILCRFVQKGASGSTE